MDVLVSHFILVAFKQRITNMDYIIYKLLRVWNIAHTLEKLNALFTFQVLQLAILNNKVLFVL